MISIRLDVRLSLFKTDLFFATQREISYPTMHTTQSDTILVNLVRNLCIGERVSHILNCQNNVQFNVHSHLLITFTRELPQLLSADIALERNHTAQSRTLRSQLFLLRKHLHDSYHNTLSNTGKQNHQSSFLSQRKTHIYSVLGTIYVHLHLFTDTHSTFEHIYVHLLYTCIYIYYIRASTSVIYVHPHLLYTCIQIWLPTRIPHLKTPSIIRLHTSPQRHNTYIYTHRYIYIHTHT